MEYYKNKVSDIEKATSNNAQKLVLEKILKGMGFTQKEIMLNFLAKSKTPCSFN